MLRCHIRPLADHAPGISGNIPFFQPRTRSYVHPPNPLNNARRHQSRNLRACSRSILHSGIESPSTSGDSVVEASERTHDIVHMLAQSLGTGRVSVFASTYAELAVGHEVLSLSLRYGSTILIMHVISDVLSIREPGARLQMPRKTPNRHAGFQTRQRRVDPIPLRDRPAIIKINLASTWSHR